MITRVLLGKKKARVSQRRGDNRGQDQTEKSEDVMLLSWKVERGLQARECGKPHKKDRKRFFP